MISTNTFILNTICAGAFFVFLLLGLHFLCFKRARISRQNYRVLSGVLLIAMSLHTLFIDYETQLTTIELANTVRLVIVLLSFISVISIVSYAIYTNKGVKDEEEVAQAEEQSKNKNVEQIQQKFVQQTTPQIVEQPVVNMPEQIVQQHTEQFSSQSTDQKTEQPIEQVEEPVAEQAAEQETEQIAESTAEQETPEQVTPDTESVSETQDNEDTESASDLAVAEGDAEEEDAKDAPPIDNSNIDDLIFFQKVEALMATKRLFCEQDINREQIAFAIGTNRTYLARSIKNATGKTFLEYITDLRTSYAATLLTTTNEPLDVIGTIAGFGSKSAYYRAFSAAYGCSPSEYRKR